MSEATEQLNSIELSLNQAKATIATRDALRRLQANKDFDEVINKGFFDRESRRVVLFRASPEAQDESVQKEVNDVITSIGGLYHYFHTIMQLGQMAENAVEADEEARAEILAEQLGEDEVI